MAHQQQLWQNHERSEELHGELIAIEHKLKKKNISQAHRDKLKRQRTRVVKTLHELNPGKVLIMKGPLQGKLVNAG